MGVIPRALNSRIFYEFNENNATNNDFQENIVRGSARAKDWGTRRIWPYTTGSLAVSQSGPIKKIMFGLGQTQLKPVEMEIPNIL